MVFSWVELEVISAKRTVSVPLPSAQAATGLRDAPNLLTGLPLGAGGLEGRPLHPVKMLLCARAQRGPPQDARPGL